MKSSFVRKGAASAADTGTRPGLHGQTLISTGLADWDKLLRGGLALGTLTLLVEDCHSHQHLNLIRYFIAEAVTTKQPATWFTCHPPKEGVADFLPSVVLEDSGVPGGATVKKAANPTTSTQEADTQELRIAWQYRKYIQSAQSEREQQQAEDDAAAAAGRAKARAAASTVGAGGNTMTTAQKTVESGVSRSWCHTYDLTRGMAPELVQQHGLVCQGPASGFNVTSAVSQATEFIRKFTPPPPPLSATGVPVVVRPSAGSTAVGRVVIQSLLSPAWTASDTLAKIQDQGHSKSSSQVAAQWPDEEMTWREAARALLTLRRAVQDARCAVLVTLQADLLPPSWLIRLQHLCHIVMTLDSISDSSDVYKLLPDPTTAAALLSIQRLPSQGMVAPRIPDNQLYVLRHKRRKLAITPVEVDPDAEARQQEAVTAAAAGICNLGLKQQQGGKGDRVGAKASGRAQPAQGLEF